MHALALMSQGDRDIGLENAGAYLGDTFGPLMRVIWAVGLLAAGESLDTQPYNRCLWTHPARPHPACCLHYCMNPQDQGRQQGKAGLQVS